MTHIFAVNGSPNMDAGHTGRLLSAVLAGAQEAGATSEIVYPDKMDLQPCTGEMHCWFRQPGSCYIADDMQALYPRLRAADILLLAAPVYAPLPGRMQDLLNRLVPLLTPQLAWRSGRTRARFRDGVAISRIALVATGGWWEVENLDVVLHIAEEMAANASVPFAGAVLRPHAMAMLDATRQQTTPAGQKVLAAAQQAGRELVELGEMQAETLAAVSAPLVSEPELRRWYTVTAQRLERRG